MNYFLEIVNYHLNIVGEGEACEPFVALTLLMGWEFTCQEALSVSNPVT